MQNINLNKDLIVLGGLKNSGKTRFALQWANQLAEKEHVLYVSYQDYPEKLYAELQRMGCLISEKLKIQSNLVYYSAEFFMQVLQLIKLKGYTTLIIDDMECLNQFQDFDQYNYLDEENSNPLHFIAELMDIRIIVLLNIMSGPLDAMEQFPQLKHFVYSRSLVIHAAQVFALIYPFQQGIKEDGYGNSLINRIELHDLKNEEHEYQVYELDNRKMNIYDH